MADLPTAEYTTRVRGWFAVLLGTMVLIYSIGALVGRVQPGKHAPIVGCIFGVAFIVFGIARIRGWKG